MMTIYYISERGALLTIADLMLYDEIRYSPLKPNAYTGIRLLDAGTADLSAKFIGHITAVILAAGANHLTFGQGAQRVDGATGDDWLAGGLGADTIMGGAGFDTLYGGAGNDVLNLGNPGDTLTARLEIAYGGDGDDQISALVEYATTFGRLGLYGGTGNDLLSVAVQQITGDFFGGAGNDTLIVQGGFGGFTRALGDLVLTLANGIEEVQLHRALDFDDAAHAINIGPAQLICVAGYNPTCDIRFGAGADLLRAAGVTGRIDMGAGNDTVYAGQGEADIWGGAGDDLLFLGAGNDVVHLGEGRDTVFGGAGDDRFYLSLGGPLATLRGEAGNDTLVISGSGAVLRLASMADLHVDMMGVENLALDPALRGSDLADLVDLRSLTLVPGAVIDLTRARATHIDLGAGRDTFFGSAGQEAIDGGAGADRIDTGAGDDFLIGGPGDTLIGGAGNDTYIVSGQTRIVELAGGGRDTVFGTGDFDMALTPNVEVFYAEGLPFVTAGRHLSGNGLANLIVGSSANDTLIGGAGDTLAGIEGDDTYVIDVAGVKIIEAPYSYNDRVLTSLSDYMAPAGIEEVVYTGQGNFTGRGGGQAKLLVGGAGNDLLFNAWTMQGGAGDDTYTVTDVTRALPKVIEEAGGGHDVVYTKSFKPQGFHEIRLWANVEDLILTSGGCDLLGNDLDNLIIGANEGSRFYGGLGADTLKGGTGDDAYWIDQAGDVVIDAGGAHDGLNITGAGVYQVFVGIETIDLRADDIEITGTDADETYRAWGRNDLIDAGGGNDRITCGMANDSVRGGAGDDTIDGGFGNDLMVGGLGNDTYYLGSADDIVIDEGGADDHILILGNGLFYVPLGIERITLQGGGVAVSGNAAAETYQGSVAQDLFDGGDGADTLTGGAGRDGFYYWALGEADVIMDFTLTGENADVFLIEGGADAAFDLTEGDLLPAAFANLAAAQALTATTRLYYADHGLYYDADGSGAGAGVLLATLTGAQDFAGLTAAHFLVV